MDPTELVGRLTRAGCVFPEAEAEELRLAAGNDRLRLEDLVRRRESGEPLAWITGSTRFCGYSVRVAPGIYVPRPHSEGLALLAASLLPPRGRAVDLGTGSGAVALVMQRTRPTALVIGVELDHAAAECARSNHLAVVEGDLFSAAPESWIGSVDVITGVLPYVPTGEMEYLPHDVVAFEPRQALDGGAGGLVVVTRACREAARWLRPGGHLLLEVGGDQILELSVRLPGMGLDLTEVLRDEDADLRGFHAISRP
jgi:release factor glutamine methyltransferase